MSAVERAEHTYEIIVTPGKKPERLDAYITRSIAMATRTRVQKAIDAGSVLVNGTHQKANYKVKPNDVITVTVMRPPPLQLVPQDIPLDILYEDEYLMVIDKAPGILVHPGLGNRDGTLVNAVLWHLGQRDPIDVLKAREDWGDDEGESDGADESEISDESELWTTERGLEQETTAIRPGIVHRLDRDTSGVMVIGKTYLATMQLATQFAERTVSRQYVALCWGVLGDDQLLIEGDIGRSPRDRTLRAIVRTGGKYAATEVTVHERFLFASLVTCKLRTGRTHQIRVHLSSRKHPLIGDPDYGGRDSALLALHHAYRQQGGELVKRINRQALHARSLEFTHPITKERLVFESPLPEDMQQCLDLLRG
jgi:23S rRNA pseudouridine1911/1915/1917 synthase